MKSSNIFIYKRSQRCFLVKFAIFLSICFQIRKKRGKHKTQFFHLVGDVVNRAKMGLKNRKKIFAFLCSILKSRFFFLWNHISIFKVSIFLCLRLFFLPLNLILSFFLASNERKSGYDDGHKKWLWRVFCVHTWVYTASMLCTLLSEYVVRCCLKCRRCLKAVEKRGEKNAF